MESALAARPDVVLMDIAMPDLGGLEATLAIRNLNPESKVVILTQYDNRDYVYTILTAGAAGSIAALLVSAALTERAFARADNP